MNERYNLILGDCLQKMKELPDASVDAIVCDPPYGLEFMGKDWDKFKQDASWNKRGEDWHEKFGNSAFGRILDKAPVNWSQCGLPFQEFNFKWATEALRVLKAGGFMFAMGGTRTHHRLTCGIEDAGFLIRDELCWVYLQGFPKAQDLGMLIEKKLGGEGEFVCENPAKRPCNENNPDYETSTGWATPPRPDKMKPTKEQAKAWAGWKTPALKPAHEPIVVAQKPCEGSITENVMKLGVGGYNIDACRIPYENGEDKESNLRVRHCSLDNNCYGTVGSIGCGDSPADEKGRYPSNLMMTEPCFFKGAEGVVIESKGISGTTKYGGLIRNIGSQNKGYLDTSTFKISYREKQYAQEPAYMQGNLNRFFLIPKASKGEKEEDLEDWEEVKCRGDYKDAGQFGILEKIQNSPRPTAKNFHPTVKPVLLMEHLIKLTTTNHSIVLDPFMGSGTSGVAALNLNRKFIGIEIDEGYFKIAEKRISEAAKQEKLGGL